MQVTTKHIPEGARHHSDHFGWPLVLAALCVGLIVRLWGLPTAPFISDEPVLLSAARDQLVTGRWVAVSPLNGTQGVHYGPTVIWFYSCLQWAFGYGPMAALVAMCILTTAAQALVATTAARVFGGGRMAFLLTFALLLSSPYLYYWSRLAWDQSVLICVAAVVAVLGWRPDLRIGHAVTVGVLLGLAISSHLMVVPFAACVIGVVGWEMRGDAYRLIRMTGSLILPALLVNVPYLWHLATNPQHPAPARPDPQGFLANLAETPTIVTSFRIESFLDPLWAEFTHRLGRLEPLLNLRPILVVAVSVAAAFGLVISWSGHDPRERRIARLALTTWIVSAVGFALQGVNQVPHYQFATWWAVPMGLAAALRLAGSRPPVLRTAVVSSIGVIVLQLLFVAAWAQFRGDASGTDGVHPPTSLGEQIEVARAICSVAESSVMVRNETTVFSESVGYLTVIETGCRTKRIAFCTPPRCPPDEPGLTQLRLVYEDEQGSRLKMVPFD